MSTELEQLAIKFRKENVGIYPAHGSGFVEVIKSDFEANFANLLREVQRQTIEAVEAEIGRNSIIDLNAWLESPKEVRRRIRSLLSPSQEAAQ